MSKKDKTPGAKMSEALTTIVGNMNQLHDYVGDVVIAQNQSGVLVMTLLQMLIEKGVLDKKEVEDRVEASKELVLDKTGECKKPLSTILQEPGGQDEHTGSEDEVS